MSSPRSAMQLPMRLCHQILQVRQPGDLTVVSAHWGSNWGYRVAADHVRFAHRLVDGGVDLVHGHSSHHPRPIEVYRGKLILYGCGDLVDDYEGIRGHDQYRPDLRLLYLPRLDPTSGELVELRMVALQARQMRLHRASHRDAQWLKTVLDKVSRPFGSRIDLGSDGCSAFGGRPDLDLSGRSGAGTCGRLRTTAVALALGCLSRFPSFKPLTFSAAPRPRSLPPGAILLSRGIPPPNRLVGDSNATDGRALRQEPEAPVTAIPLPYNAVEVAAQSGLGNQRSGFAHVR